MVGEWRTVNGEWLLMAKPAASVGHLDSVAMRATVEDLHGFG